MNKFKKYLTLTNGVYVFIALTIFGMIGYIKNIGTNLLGGKLANEEDNQDSLTIEERKNLANHSTLTESKATDFANQIWAGVDYIWGTDEEALKFVLDQINSRQDYSMVYLKFGTKGFWDNDMTQWLIADVKNSSGTNEDGMEWKTYFRNKLNSYGIGVSF